MTVLKKQLEYVAERSVFYQNKFKHINGSWLDAFQALPFTTKKEILEDQAEHRPFGSNLCIDERDIVRVHKTSGTTNKPVIVVLTAQDVEYTVRVGSACFALSGLCKDDMVVHCLNYNMWAGGYTDHQSLERTGAAVVPFGVGYSKALIETILRLKVSAIHCTPSYLSKLEYLLKEEFHITPQELKLRLGLFGAESGLQNPDFRRNIEETWGLKAMNANYGMSEVLSMFGAESEKQNGLHFMGGEVLFPELIDPVTEKVLPIEKDVVGELVLTNITKEAQPLIRYRTGDIFRILDPEKNNDRVGFRFDIVGRTDDMLVVKGVNLFISSIDTVINRYLQFVTGTYNILVNEQDPIDRVQLKIELREDLSPDQIKQVKIDIMNECVEDLHIRPILDLVPLGSIERVEGKSKKLHRIL